MPSTLTATPTCRACGAPLRESFADLGRTPVSNAFRHPEDQLRSEIFYPLHAYVCSSCLLVQLQDFHAPDEIFTDQYAYYSSYSETWLEHARAYAEMMMARFAIGPGQRVVEVASNDGYLLQYFKQAGVQVLGIEPAANVAEAARRDHDIPSEVCFFGRQTADKLAADGLRADLMVANNVLAHVPDINDFVAGFPRLLAKTGIATFEFPHLLELIEHNQFDTIYHEHFSYLSLVAVEQIFARQGLAVFEVETLPTHGGSLRLFATHAGLAPAASVRLEAMRERERAFGLTETASYRAFADRVRRTKRRVLAFLIRAKEEGRKVVAYGAPAKGNTLLNYCGIGPDMIDFTVDRSPHKQGLFLPGTGIPIRAPEAIAEARPDFVLILPWNLKEEIMAQMAHVRDWGGRFVVPIPEVEVL